MSIVDSCTYYDDQITVSKSVLNMLQKNLCLAATLVDIHQGFWLLRNWHICPNTGQPQLVQYKGNPLCSANNLMGYFNLVWWENELRIVKLQWDSVRHFWAVKETSPFRFLWFGTFWFDWLGSTMVSGGCLLWKRDGINWMVIGCKCLNHSMDQIIHFSGIFPYKPSIWRYPHDHGTPHMSGWLFSPPPEVGSPPARYIVTKADGLASEHFGDNQRLSIGSDWGSDVIYMISWEFYMI